jgi:hypothetical protein
MKTLIVMQNDTIIGTYLVPDDLVYNMNNLKSTLQHRLQVAYANAGKMMPSIELRLECTEAVKGLHTPDQLAKEVVAAVFR